MHKIGENLKNLRKKAGLSYRRLAEQVGISHNNIASYEKDEIVPSLENAIKICSFFNVPLEYLILGDKANAKYNDFKLFKLFTEADNLDKEYRILIKTYIKKVITHSKEKQKLKAESESPPVTKK